MGHSGSSGNLTQDSRGGVQRTENSLTGLLESEENNTQDALLRAKHLCLLNCMYVLCFHEEPAHGHKERENG